MKKDQQDRKRFLKEQLQWSKEQVRIIDEINVKLHQMKEIADYAFKHELAKDEMEKLNSQLNDLKHEANSLEKQLQSVVH